MYREREREIYIYLSLYLYINIYVRIYIYIYISESVRKVAPPERRWKSDEALTGESTLYTTEVYTYPPTNIYSI